MLHGLGEDEDDDHDGDPGIRRGGLEDRVEQHVLRKREQRAEALKAFRQLSGNATSEIVEKHLRRERRR